MLYLGSSRAVITCLVTGGIRTVEWRKDSTTVISSNDTETSSRHRILPSGSLQITNVSESDSGDYTCGASNKAGEETRHIKVEVQHKVSSLQPKLETQGS